VRNSGSGTSKLVLASILARRYLLRWTRAGVTGSLARGARCVAGHKIRLCAQETCLRTRYWNAVFAHTIRVCTHGTCRRNHHRKILVCAQEHHCRKVFVRAASRGASAPQPPPRSTRNQRRFGFSLKLETRLFFKFSGLSLLCSALARKACLTRFERECALMGECGGFPTGHSIVFFLHPVEPA